MTKPMAQFRDRLMRTLQTALPRALAAALALCTAACGPRTADSQPLRIEISHVVGDQPLQLGQDYTTAAGDHWSADKLRYYLSNFRLRRSDGGWFVNPQREDRSDGYFLVDEADGSSKQLSIGPVTSGQYGGIEFLIGVDPQRNTAGAQTGTLDPTRGMFWTWNTGYMYLLFEGHSPQSADEAHALSYHVGGGSAAPARSVYLPLQPAITLDAAHGAEIHLYADVGRLFEGAHTLRFAATASAMDPATATLVEDNSAAMFRVDHVHRLATAVAVEGT